MSVAVAVVLWKKTFRATLVYTKSVREKNPLSSPVHEVRNSGADAMFWRLFESFCGCVTHCFSARALCCRYFFQASVFSIRPLSRCLFKFHVGDKKVKQMKNYQINGTLSHFLSRFAFFPHLIFLERKRLMQTITAQTTSALHVLGKIAGSFRERTLRMLA